MRGRLRLGLSGVVLAAAVVVSLAACGGGSDDGGTAGTEQPAVEATASSESPASQDPETSPEADGIPDETVPEEELTPAEGEFSEEQREYLADRVPRGVDPAAILEVGDEACYRIGYLERHDRAGALRALRDGEIPNAEAAVEHLCPEYAELLAEATD
ncbi:hypothetical protein E1265_10475 [Streptomyces sp. 8K308]|uniref:hypothetical protein n=1 Tax=Streptomyces sp. 8K308 TaxID=2530388 RepID=UPI00104C65CA|nr:hypothetical protein [Streptomyces sp. 8K308]TDC24184.1 hypothetical protein E1265_10475 [Streptomyces sp. 8K308]